MATYYVDTDVAGGAGDGSSWANAYATLNDAETARDADITGAGPVVFNCRGATNPDTEAVDFLGWTTTADDYIVASTEQANRHDGKWNTTKYRLEVANSSVLAIHEDYVRIDGLQLLKTDSSANYQNGVLIDGITATNNDSRISNCIVRGHGDITFIEPGILVNDADAITKVWNTLVYGCSAYNSAYSSALYAPNASVVTAYSCTFIGGLRGVNAGATATITCKNCYASRTGSAAAFTNVDTMVTCASSDATGSVDLRNIAVDTDTFVNVTAGSEDFHLAADGLSPLVGQGTDTSGESAPLNFTTDIDGQTRDATWDIGSDAWEALLKSITDAGAGSETISQILASVGLSDAGSGVDGFGGGTQASVPLADAGAGLDSLAQLLASLGIADSGAGAEAALSIGAGVPVSDAGAGAEGTPDIGASVPLVDGGSGADAVASLSVTLSIADTASGAEAINVLTALLKSITDAGAGADTVGGISVTLAVTDAGAGTEAPSITVIFSVADAGSGADAIDVITAALKTVLDAGSGADATPGISISLSVPETAAGAESLGVVVSLTIQDVGAGADLATTIQAALKSILDAGAGSDAIGAITVAVPVADAGAAADLVAGISAALTVADLGSGQDLPSVSVQLMIGDAGAGAEGLSVLQQTFISILDAGAATEAIGSITVQARVTDAAAGADVLAAIAAALSVSDAAAGTDVVLSFDVAIKIVRATFVFKRPSATFALARRRITFTLN